MDSVLSFKLAHEDFPVEYEILTPYGGDRISDIEHEIREVDDQLMLCQQEADTINEDIDKLTNHADGVDYTIAALSGILAGIIDSLFVDEWNMAEARAWNS